MLLVQTNLVIPVSFGPFPPFPSSHSVPCTKYAQCSLLLSKNGTKMWSFLNWPLFHLCELIFEANFVVCWAAITFLSYQIKMDVDFFSRRLARVLGTALTPLTQNIWSDSPGSPRAAHRQPRALSFYGRSRSALHSRHFNLKLSTHEREELKD